MNCDSVGVADGMHGNLTALTVVSLAKLFRLTIQVISQYAVVSNHKKNTH